MDEYPPGVRAPGEGYTGPIADPDEAMRAALASQDVLAQAARYAADPDAPIKAYLSAMEMWKNPAKYAGYPRPEAALARVHPPVPQKVPPPETVDPQPADDAVVPTRDEAPREAGTQVVYAAAAGTVAAPTVAGVSKGGAAALVALGRGAAAVAGSAAAGVIALGIVLWPSRTAGPEVDGTRHLDMGQPLPPSPGFSPAPPQGGQEGFDAARVEPTVLPTPIAPEGESVEHGPSADGAQGPDVWTMAQKTSRPFSPSQDAQDWNRAQQLGYTRPEYDDLARDADQGNRVTVTSEWERNSLLEAQERGLIAGPLRRGLRRTDAVDGAGQTWDVKSFDSNFRPSKGGFTPSKAVRSIEDELAGGHNVLVETRWMKPADVQALQQEAALRGWGDRVRMIVR